MLKNPNRQPLLICTRCHTQDNPAEMHAESTSSISTWGRCTLLRLSTVKIHGLDTNKRPPKNKTRFFVSAWRPRKSSFTPFLLVWEALFIPHTLWITLKSSALMHIKPIRLPSNYMLIQCSMCSNWQQLDALLNNPVALKVLIWSRGRLVTLQILTSSSFSLVEETHGSLGQCVSFSLVDVGRGFTA